MIQADLSSVNALTGHLEGLAKGLQSKSYINSVLEYSHALMVEDLDNFVDSVAKAAPVKYHHVYEWPTTFENWGETVGVKTYRLWRHTLTGPMGNKVASYRFIASKRTVPVNPKLKAVGVVDKVHIFYLKASVFELGLQVTVRPSLKRRNGEKVGLSFIDTRPGPNFGKPVFIPGEDAETNPPIPGGEKSLQGNFTGLYSLWWGAEADKFFNDKIQPKLVRDLPLKKLVKKSSGGSVGLKIKSDNAAINDVLAQLRKNEKNYTAGAQARRDLILNNG